MCNVFKIYENVYFVVKHIVCYFKDTMNMNLFYSNVSKSILIDFINTNYLSYHHNVLL